MTNFEWAQQMNRLEQVFYYDGIMKTLFREHNYTIGQWRYFANWLMEEHVEEIETCVE